MNDLFTRLPRTIEQKAIDDMDVLLQQAKAFLANENKTDAKKADAIAGTLNRMWLDGFTIASREVISARLSALGERAGPLFSMHEAAVSELWAPEKREAFIAEIEKRAITATVGDDGSPIFWRITNLKPRITVKMTMPLSQKSGGVIELA